MTKLKGFRLPIDAILLLGAIVLVFILMFAPGGAEWYYRNIYLNISPVLAGFASIFPFSLSDCVIYGSIAFLLFYLVRAIVLKKSWKKTLGFVCSYIGWIFVWFYLAWGLNYYRPNFYQRALVKPVEFSEESFNRFLSAYTDSLNSTFVSFDSIDEKTVAMEVAEGYEVISDRFELPEIKGGWRAKPMLLKSLMSGCSILGYIGPFFNEYTLNQDLLPVQYPFTYAHEMAHVLGISNEAEANLYAYLVCTSSSNLEVRFSGYFGLLRYVMRNAYTALPADDVERWMDSVNPEVKELFLSSTDYWAGKYSDKIGKAQHVVYDAFLKSNKISSGHANYSEVIGMLMAIQSDKFDDEVK